MQDTSLQAYERVASSAEAIRQQVLAEIRKQPATADAVASRLDIDFINVRPRCTELKLAGLIKYSGARATSRSGKSAIVWQATSQEDAG